MPATPESAPSAAAMREAAPSRSSSPERAKWAPSTAEMSRSALRSRVRRSVRLSSSPSFRPARSSSPIWKCRLSIRRDLTASSIWRAEISRRMAVSSRKVS